jgi:hypothetical protein
MDSELMVGGRKLKMSHLRTICPDDRREPRAETVAGKVARGRVEGLGVVRIRPGVMGTLHLEWAERITVRAFDLASHDVTILVEAKQGPKVVAMVRKKIKVESN